MMKKLIFILLISCLSGALYAQNKEIEAIATYQMAEESFDAKNYEDALKHINTTKTILGTANSKILYLEVQILEELSKAKPEYLKDLQTAIHAFGQAPDIDQFSQEKRVEVAKIKMDAEDKTKRIEKAAFEEKERLKIFQELPKLGTHIDEFLKHPYVKKYSERLTEKEKKKLLKGKYFYIGTFTFSGNKEGERIVNYISTDKEGKVRDYNVQVGVNEAELNEGLISFLGKTNFDKLIVWDEYREYYLLYGDNEVIMIDTKYGLRSGFIYRERGEEFPLNRLDISVRQLSDKN